MVLRYKEPVAILNLLFHIFALPQLATMLRPLILVACILSLNYSGFAQTRYQVHTGLGYLEHFSLGVGCTFSNKHEIGAFYGSDFFVHPNNFSTLLLQYNRIL